MRALIADVCVSEFGWELMAWQAFVRASAQHADEVVICSTQGHQALYDDLNPIFIPHEIQGMRDCHKLKPCSTPKLLQQAQQEVQEYVSAFRKNGYQIHQIKPTKNYPLRQQHFIPFGNEDNSQHRSDLIVHARDRQKPGPFSGVNWPQHKWDELVTQLGSEVSIAAIGTLEQALCPAGAVDLRDSPMSAQMDLMAAAQLTVGPSSGPMLMSLLCHTPIVVWTDDRRRPVTGKSVRARFERDWNPFQIPTFVMDTDADPAVSDVVANIRTCLRKDNR